MVGILRRQRCASRRCAVTPPADHTPAPESPPPLLIGRERELRGLRDRLGAALDGRGSLVLIGGEAGVGKTTLARALCQEAAEQGALVLRGGCYDLSETPPYGPWTEAFGSYEPHDDLPSPPEAFGRTNAANTITTRSALFDGARHFVATLAERRPSVMLLEDLHWADPESLDLLRIVTREANAQRHRRCGLRRSRGRGEEGAGPYPHRYGLAGTGGCRG